MKTSHRTFMHVAAALLVLAPGLLLAQQTLTVTPNTLSFSAQSGSTTAQTASIGVSSAGPSGTVRDYLASAGPAGITWLSVTPTSGTTPANLTVTVNPAGLSTGTYVGSVMVAIGGLSQSVPVSLTVGQLGASPTSVSFSYLTGGPLPATQVVQISAQSAVAFNSAVTTASGANWLIVAPSASTAPGSVSISLNPQVVPTLAQGNYSGTVTLTPTTGNNLPLTIPVTLAVSPTPQLTVTPAALSFNYQIGGANNQVQQNVSLSSTGSPLNFSIDFPTTSSGGQWLVVNPTSGLTPSSLTVGVQPASLIAGTYQGTITVRAPGATNATQNIAVTLTVSVNPLLSLSPNALEFSYQIGTPSPAAKTIKPTSTSGALNYMVTAAVNKGANWLTINTPAGTTPSEISISVNPAGLTADTYTGTVTVTAQGAGNPPQTVPVTLKVSNDPLLTINRTINPNTLAFNYEVGQVGPQAQVIELGTTTGAALNYTVTSAGGDWLKIISSGTSTPATISVFANTTSISEGTYEGSITVAATSPTTGEPAPNSPLIIPVKFYVSADPLLNVSKQSLTMSSVNGAVATDTISLTSTSDPLSFTVAFTTASGGNWLTLGPVSGTTPSVLTVSAVPGSLQPGSYAGSITITSTNPNVVNSPIQIPVTLTVASGSLVVPAAPLAFTHPQGGTAPAQTVQISQSGLPLNFTASPSTTSGGTWLSVTPPSGTTPNTLSISVASTSLPQGTYQGSVTIVSPGALNSPQIIPVTLTVTVPQTIAVTPATLAFSYQVGSTAVPAAQRISVTSTGGNVTFNASATTRDGGTWLKLGTSGGQTAGAAGSVGVSVDPTGLAAGTYTGTISITAAAAGNSPQTVTVTLTVTAMAVPSGLAIANAASWASGAVAPGEIVVIGGRNLGVTTLTSGKLNSAGNLDTTLAEVQVLFDGVPAPIVYVSDTQLSVVVPYELAGRVSTRLQVAYKGAVSQPLELRVTDAAPGIFTLNAAGTGPGAILNQNGSVNTSSNPAQKGSVVVIYATGEGATNPRGINGRITPLDPNALARPLLPVTVLIGGRQATVHYAGSAPGLVAGALQINAVVPAEVASGSAVPVVVTIGSASSQANVTVAVQ